MVVLLNNSSGATFDCFPTLSKKKAVLKLDDDKSPTPPLLQENVFIESSRPKYLENLHSEALEGLKMMQQEESNNGVDCKDNESTVSTMTVHTDGEGGGFITDSTIGDTTSVVSVQSSVSTRSSRSGLTRQESTFRPLNSGTKSEKGKTRKRHRRTVGGIPQHVQMELGLDRGGWAVGPRLEEEEVYNGETGESSAPDGPLRTAQSHTDADGSIQQSEATLALRKEMEQLHAARGGPPEDLDLLASLVPEPGQQRPRSLAVPWGTTASSLLQKPPSPVMSMSPQAAYMSKIIPNAVLPPSIDVVEISRGRSRSSVRTVSHASLLQASPAASRSSSRACSSRASTANPQNLSDSSGWSNSGSTETLVSDSSTVSSSTTPRQQGSQDGDRSRASHTSNGVIATKRGEVRKEGPFGRSLSVMKPKKAPPPPSRSYSLYNKMKRRSRELTGIGSGESPRHVPSAEEKNVESRASPPSSTTIDSPGYNADTSSLEDSIGSASFSPVRAHLRGLKVEHAGEGPCSLGASPAKQESLQSKMASPSSGYSSQDGRWRPKQSSPTKHKSGFLAKLQRLFPGPTPAASISPPPTLPELSESSRSQISVGGSSLSPSVRALIELFNIPPPPKVHAPPPPPPEVWAHSRRTFELLLGPPAPDNISAIIKKNPKDRRQRKAASLAESAAKGLAVERKHRSPAAESENGSTPMQETKKGQESGILNAFGRDGNDRRTWQNLDLKGTESVSEADGKVSGSDPGSSILGRRSATDTSREDGAAISVVHISAPLPLLHPPTHTAEPVSPELSWPPPPPPIGLSGADDFELPFPPPPVVADGVLVAPVELPAESLHPGGGTSCSSTVSVVEAGSGRVTPAAEPQKPRKLGGNSPLPPNIPPPPPYTAPPPPLKNVSDPCLQEVSPSPPQNVAPPPPPSIQIVIPSPPPPPPKAVTPPPPPPSKAVIPPPPPPPKAVTPPPPPKAVTPPPPPKAVTPPPPPKAVTPPPPPKAVTPLPPLTEVSLPPTMEDSFPPPQSVVSPLSPVKVSPPPLVEASASFTAVEGSVIPQEVVTPVETSCVIEGSATSTLTSVKSSLADEDVSPPQVIRVSAVSPAEVEHPCIPENVLKKDSPEQVAPASIPPAEPSLLQGQDIVLPQQEARCEANQVSITSILTPPQSIPPAPPTELLHQPEGANTDGAAVQEFSTSAPPENSSQPSPATPPPSAPESMPLPPSVPAGDLSSVKLESSPASSEDQSPQVPPAPAVQGSSTPFVSPCLPPTAVSSSAEAPQVRREPEPEVVMRNSLPASSSSTEAPQKPIRRSLIINLPPPTSPPAAGTAQPPAPQLEPLVVPPVSSTSVASLTIKSPAAASGCPSMNLQEAIRLRTAARSLGGPSSRLSSHSPASPPDLRQSPSSTASFIFAKSSKKVVVETKPVAETKAATQKNQGVSSPTKAGDEAEPSPKGTKVPPPVAKKPKTNGKENEKSEGTEPSAGQEEQPDSSLGNAEKTNGAAGSVDHVTPSS